MKISIYENLLKELIDVIQAVRDELKLDPVSHHHLNTGHFTFTTIQLTTLCVCVCDSIFN